ncbi:MAG: DUF1868 domain-containing protein [Paracoccaceae bacterium]
MRFDASGRALRCSGNTVIAHVHEGPAKTALDEARSRLSATSAGRCFAWLPASSYHMTIFDGLLHDRRDAGHWPGALPRDASNAAADAFMSSRLSSVPVPEGGFAMRATAIGGFESGAVAARLAPADAAAQARLRRYRDALAAATGLAHRPGHAAYVFHITLAYLIGWPPAEDAASFDRAAEAEAERLTRALPGLRLGPPEICRFDDMCLFRPLL